MAAAGPQAVADGSHRYGAVLRDGFKPGSELVPHVAWNVDAGRYGHQLTGGAQLGEDGRGDAEPGRRTIDARRGGARLPHAGQQPLDALPHLGLKRRRVLGQAHAMARARQRTRGDHLVDDRPEGRVVEEQRRRPAVASRLARRCAQLGDHRIHARVSAERLAPMNPAQGGEETAFGQPSLRGVQLRGVRLGGVERGGVSHVRDGERRRGQPLAEVGRVPETAIRIAWASSPESVCDDSPRSTGLAKSLVFARP